MSTKLVTVVVSSARLSATPSSDAAAHLGAQGWAWAGSGWAATEMCQGWGQIWGVGLGPGLSLWFEAAAHAGGAATVVQPCCSSVSCGVPG